MKVKFKQQGKNTIAETRLRVPGGTIILRAVTTQAEARAMLSRMQQRIGFKLSFKSLGRAVRAIAKPATLLKVTSMAAAMVANPTLAVKLGPDMVKEIKHGMAAKRVIARAQGGDPVAQGLVRKAALAAQNGSASPAPQGVPGPTWRYLVTVERLAQQASH